MAAKIAADGEEVLLRCERLLLRELRVQVAVEVAVLLLLGVAGLLLDGGVALVADVVVVLGVLLHRNIEVSFLPLLLEQDLAQNQWPCNVIEVEHHA